MLTIKDAAREVNLTPHTLRYYESEGLMPFLKRDEVGHRVFGQEDIEWLQFICCLRNTGMSIREMKSFVKLYEQGDATIPERMDVLYEHRLVIEDKLKEMQQYLVNINNKIRYYEGVYEDVLDKEKECLERCKNDAV